MRSKQTLLALALCISLASAVQELSEDQTAQQEQSSQQVQQQGIQQAAFDAAPPQMTEEQAATIRKGFKDLMEKFPVQTVQPLFETMDGYCKAFNAVCVLACEERAHQAEAHSEDGKEVKKLEKREAKESNGCADPKAQSILMAAATCQCAEIDLTDRVNFAIVGGIVSKSSRADFAAEDILLDGLMLLPQIPVFQNILQVAQSVCTFVAGIKNLAPSTPGAHPPVSTTPSPTGNILGTLTGLFPGLGAVTGLVPGVGAISPLLPLLGGLFGGNAIPAPELQVENAAPEQQQKSELLEEDSDENRLVSKDGRVARITRVQKRQVKKMASKKDL